MSSSLRRGALAATVVFTIAPLVASCGTGFNAETGLVAPINASTEVEDIRIQNVNVVVDDDGAAGISGRIFNDGGEDRQLLSITLPDSGTEIELVPVEGETTVNVPAGGMVGLGGEGNPAGFIADAEDAGIALGNAQHLVFDLEVVGTASLRATVVPTYGADGAYAYYESWGPTAPPEPESEDTPGQPDGAGEDGAEEDGAEGSDEPGSPGEETPGGPGGTEDGDEAGVPGTEDGVETGQPENVDSGS